jgi:hypothetical protein
MKLFTVQWSQYFLAAEEAGGQAAAMAERGKQKTKYYSIVHVTRS